MRWWLCITPSRMEKTGRIMHALKMGWPDSQVITGAPPNDGVPFQVWGQLLLADDIIRKAYQTKRNFFQIDNGFHKPSRGQPHGYYRFMYSRPDPVLVSDNDLIMERMATGSIELSVDFKPMRKDGWHILIAMPGEEFGASHGLKMRPWMDSIVDKVKAASGGRPIRVRDRMATHSLDGDLRGCWAVVTHSSNVAVDSVKAGIPVFVEPTSMAAPVGNLTLATMDTPHFPTVDFLNTWWWSLMCQQFTIKEMARGTAFHFLSAIHGLPVRGTVQ